MRWWTGVVEWLGLTCADETIAYGIIASRRMIRRDGRWTSMPERRLLVWTTPGPSLLTYEMDLLDDVGLEGTTDICHWIHPLPQPYHLPSGNETLNESSNGMRSMGSKIRMKPQRRRGQDCFQTLTINLTTKLHAAYCDLPLFVIITRSRIRTRNSTTTLSKVPLPVSKTAWYFRCFTCFTFWFRRWLEAFDLLETTLK